MKNIFKLFLFIAVFFINTNSYALSVKNQAEGTYIDDKGVTQKILSNTQETNVIPINRDFFIRAKKNELEGKALSTWLFPSEITNAGDKDETYNLTIENLVAGTTFEIYEDLNNNGLIDEGENKIVSTPKLKPSETFNFIVAIKDIIGLANNTIVQPKLSGITILSPSISKSDDLKIRVITPTSTTPIDTNNGIKAPQLVTKKSVYPSGNIRLGDILLYTIEVENKGNDTALYPSLIDKLPEDVLLLIDNPIIANLDADISYSNDKVTWYNLPNTDSRYIKFSWDKIEPDVRVQASFKVKVKESAKSGSIDNQAYIEYPYKEEKGNIITKKETMTILTNTTTNVIQLEYFVSGTVIDKKTGLPLDKAIIKVLDKDGKEVATYTTGKLGTFKIPLPDKGLYTVIYQDPSGTLITQKNVNVQKVGDNKAPIEISGKVIDSQSKKLIANALVELLDEKGNVIATTNANADGLYQFSKDAKGNELKPGTYYVRVTKANGYTTYGRVDVGVKEGDVIVNLDLLVDPFGIVYDELGGLDVRIKDADVRLINSCDNPNSFVKLEDLAPGQSQSNPITTKEDGFYQYFLSKEQLTFKQYCLLVKANGYESRQFIVRTMPSDEKVGKYMLNIFDEKAQLTVIKDVESIPFNIPMKPLKIFEINKKVNKQTINIGDTVVYTVDVTNKLKFTLKNGIVFDKLPEGFKYVPNTLSINGKKVENFEAVEKMEIKLGDMPPEKKFTLVYQTRTGIRVSGGASINEARVQALSPNGTKLEGGPAKAIVFVRKDIFGYNGAIIGRVFIDNNNNGIPDDKDIGLENIELYTANGLRILTDKNGKYSVPDLPPGDFILHIDRNSLPKNVYPISEAIQLTENKNKELEKLTKKNIDISKDRFVNITDGILEFNSDKKFQILINNKTYNSDDNNQLKINSSILTLKEKNNNIKIISGNIEKIITLYYIPKFESPVKEAWIGEDDIIRRVFITESGLGKANFRLVQLNDLDKKIELGKPDDSLGLAFLFPDQISVKKIPYITYPDIKDHWSRKVVEYESGLEIIHGYPDGNFKPERNITRAEATKLILVAMKSYDIQMFTTIRFFVNNEAPINLRILKDNKVIRTFYNNKILKEGFYSLDWNGFDDRGNLLGLGKYIVQISDDLNNKIELELEIIKAKENYKADGKSTFYDVKENHWASPFIKVASDEKIVNGYNDNSFKPDSFIPRYELAVIVSNALGNKTQSVNNPFVDFEKIPNWAKSQVLNAYSNKLLIPFEDNTFRPDKLTTRAEVAQFIANLINAQTLKGKLKGFSNNKAELLLNNMKLNIGKGNFEFDFNKAILDKELKLIFDSNEYLELKDDLFKVDVKKRY